MKKLILPVVIGIAIGLGGSTAAVVLLGGEPESLAESLNAALGEEPVDSAMAGDSLTARGNTLSDSPDSLPLAGADATTIDGSAVSGAPTPGTVENVTAAVPPPPGGGMASADLAGLFGTMQAREAARVLEHMDDFEVQMILGQLGKREAAAILSNLSPERAAVISRSVLRGERSTQ